MIIIMLVRHYEIFNGRRRVVNIKALIKGNIGDQYIIDELNRESKICEYKLLKQSNLSMSSDMLIIIFEIVKNLGSNATYDLLKMAVLELVSKICVIRKRVSVEKETSIIIIVDGKRAEVNISFALSEEQKDKIVDAAIRKLFD